MKKWKTILALILMMLAILFDWAWVWVLLVVFGLIKSVQSNEIHFIEVVKKVETPYLYYTLIGFWIVLSSITIWQYLHTLNLF
ncbi:MAG: hypothetical protein ACPG6V_12650 [Flavobacteriales bacterium]